MKYLNSFFYKTLGRGAASWHAGLSSLGRRLEGRPVDLGRAEALRRGEETLKQKKNLLEPKLKFKLN